MNLGRGQGHRAANILDLNPRPGEICRPFKFGQDAGRALLDYLRNEFMSIEQLATDRCKQTPLPGLTRVVGDVGYDDGRIAIQTGPGDACDVAKGNGAL